MISYKNRGKPFEQLIDYTNEQYKAKGWGLVDQVPTPAKQVKGRMIYTEKSTVDFIGLSHGRGLAFDAKSTKEKNRFDLKNVHDHQVDYLKEYQDQGGIAFLLIHFEKHRETYFVPFDFFHEYWNKALQGGRKSIPYQDISLYCDQVKSERGVLLDYLKYCG